MTDYADQLIAELEQSARWPLQREVDTLKTVEMRRAFRRADALRNKYDRGLLLQLANWEQRARELFVGPVQREYVIDPLPRRIALAFADFLWGAEADFDAADETDQPWVDLIVSENQLASKLHRAETLIVSEGEAWWKVWVDRECAITPLVDWCSRLAVVPLWRGSHLLACAFFTEVAIEGVGATSTVSDQSASGATVWRHVEVHTDRRVVNLLYKGSRGELGKRVDLAEREETADLQDVWNHGLPMLAGRIVNDIDDDPSLGISDYDQQVDFFLALNEARTIGAENTRLTAKKRLFVAGSLIEPDGTFDAGSDVIAVDQAGGTLGDSTDKAPVTEVEYSFDAKSLIEYDNDLEAAILSRVGLVPQLLGRGVEGHSQSGTAIRLRFLPTENAAGGKAREWDDKGPHILHLTMLVDALPEERGGFGRSYSNLLAPPTIERGSILPRDEAEIVEENATAVGSGIRSRETAIREQHPEWTDEDVEEELKRIEEDEKVLGPIPPPEPGADIPPPSAMNRFEGRVAS